MWRVCFVLVLMWSGDALAESDPWFGPDKALHFGVSAGVSSLGYGLAALATDSMGWRIVAGLGAGVLLGAGKELLDLAGFGVPSWKDMAWDVIGSVVGVLVAVCVDWICRVFFKMRLAQQHLWEWGTPFRWLTVSL